jgi:hypothetical protein
MLPPAVVVPELAVGDASARFRLRAIGSGTRAASSGRFEIDAEDRPVVVAPPGSSCRTPGPTRGVRRRARPSIAGSAVEDRHARPGRVERWSASWCRRRTRRRRFPSEPGPDPRCCPPVGEVVDSQEAPDELRRKIVPKPPRRHRCGAVEVPIGTEDECRLRLAVHGGERMGSEGSLPIHRAPVEHRALNVSAARLRRAAEGPDGPAADPTGPPRRQESARRRTSGRRLAAATRAAEALRTSATTVAGFVRTNPSCL